MKLQLVVVGKTVDKHLAALISAYENRLRHYLSYEMEVIPDLKNTKSISEEQQKKREGELIIKILREDDYVVLLDESGSELRSVEFAEWFHRKQCTSVRRIVFIVGGPYGFSEEVYALSKEKISLSRMTFSHQMIRLFFVEQCYRAMTILRGEPYHHE